MLESDRVDRELSGKQRFYRKPKVKEHKASDSLADEVLAKRFNPLSRRERGCFARASDKSPFSPPAGFPVAALWPRLEFRRPP
jgi:hypothetical protein